MSHPGVSAATTTERTSRIPVAILGATGAVGQRLVERLAKHPWFELAETVASERSAGKTYGEAAHWLLDTPLPAAVAAMPVLPPGAPLSSRLVLSPLDSKTAARPQPRDAPRGPPLGSHPGP